MPQEFSKLEEFFYPPVGGAAGLSLRGFAEKSAEHYRRAAKRGPHVYRFASAGVENSLSLTVNSYAGPYVAQVRVRQTTGELIPILAHLRGALEVRYEGLSLGANADLAPAGASISGGKLYALKLTDRLDEEIGARLATLSNSTRNLIFQASAVTAGSAEYENLDPHGLLVHCVCLARRVDAGWAFDYFGSTANLDPLPAVHMDRAEHFFRLASSRFERVAVYRADTKALRKERRSDG